MKIEISLDDIPRLLTALEMQVETYKFITGFGDKTLEQAQLEWMIKDINKQLEE